MITYAQLKSIAAKNNCKVEVEPIYSKTWFNPFSGEEHRTHLGYEIAINNLYGRKGKSEWQWFWFRTLSCDETLDDSTELMFEQRYSQVTGKAHKGLWEHINAYQYIENNA